jgi:hypothetical protein
MLHLVFSCVLYTIFFSRFFLSSYVLLIEMLQWPYKSYMLALYVRTGKHCSNNLNTFTAEWENIVPQRHVFFKIFCLYNYTSLFHNIYLKGLYRHERLWNLILVEIITNEV